MDPDIILILGLAAIFFGSVIFLVWKERRKLKDRPVRPHASIQNRVPKAEERSNKS
jgi:uncharacterized iron-regulated membrane protein